MKPGNVNYIVCPYATILGAHNKKHATWERIHVFFWNAGEGAEKKPRVTEDPLAKKQQVKAAKNASGIGISQIPKPPMKKVTQTVKEKMDALKADIKSQKIQGNPVTSNISDVIAKKRGALKAKHTNFDKAFKENERIANIVKAAQEKSNAMTSAHAKQEADQLGRLLGSVQHELNPLHCSK